MNQNIYSKVKTLATSTSAFFVWIVENKLAAQLILHKIHFSSYQRHQCFIIDYQFKFLFFNNFVKFLKPFHVVHRVSQPIAPLFG